VEIREQPETVSGAGGGLVAVNVSHLARVRHAGGRQGWAGVQINWVKEDPDAAKLLQIQLEKDGVICA